jgi:hypothetical protein
MQCNPASATSARPTVPSIPTEIPTQNSAERSSEPEDIANIVHKLKGRVFTIRNAGDFVSALNRISRIENGKL